MGMIRGFCTMKNTYLCCDQSTQDYPQTIRLRIECDELVEPIFEQRPLSNG